MSNREAIYRSIPPFQDLPDWQNILTLEQGNPLIQLQEYLKPSDRIVLFPAYFEQGLEGASSRMYLRLGATHALIHASTLLPEGYQLIVYDAYRSPETQKALLDREREIMRAKEPTLPPEKLEEKILEYVAAPSYDRKKPSPHASGGAVDLSIVDATGTPLDMGTNFDALDDTSHSAYFEDGEPIHEAIRNNRRLLHFVMTQAGFTNYPGEWWHYDFGNRVHAALSGKNEAEYGLLTDYQLVLLNE